ncbi:MAG: riboflavin synthase [Betaproteobacteria bacterium]|nr:riboflavin synthase [Betaproteobacteria bacterium]
MFTGIVTAVGSIATVRPTQGGVRLHVNAPGLGLADGQIGESIAVNGVCLTAIAFSHDGFDADVSRETRRCTAGFEQGARVNLERALRLSDRLGGHLVSGHVDGVGRVVSVANAGDNRVFWFDAPPEVARYVAVKGSIAINGVSLTVNDVKATQFSVNIIPHTLAATNLGALAAGARVNLEADTVARYVERLNQFGQSGRAS